MSLHPLSHSATSPSSTIGWARGRIHSQAASLRGILQIHCLRVDAVENLISNRGPGPRRDFQAFPSISLAASSARFSSEGQTAVTELLSRLGGGYYSVLNQIVRNWGHR